MKMGLNYYSYGNERRDIINAVLKKSPFEKGAL